MTETLQSPDRDNMAAPTVCVRERARGAESSASEVVSSYLPTHPCSGTTPWVNLGKPHLSPFNPCGANFTPGP